ncbi:hypothetical protein PV327_010065 [Microctonus hyperodae]|uniref:Uncharacterized protein n=1 Tax=Microctonus hyperodae TaxID=165561 RepID=A0AA39F2A2_MICHY|nr:hypothetical protein PV327_010065 [Microctonus hyperodae]
MSNKKLFEELSKSQRNRHLRQFLVKLRSLDEEPIFVLNNINECDKLPKRINHFQVELGDDCVDDYESNYSSYYGSDKSYDEDDNYNFEQIEASTFLNNSDMILNDESEHCSASQQSISLSCQSTLESDINQSCHGHGCCKKLLTELIGLKKAESAMYLMMLEKKDAVDKKQENKINLD